MMEQCLTEYFYSRRGAMKKHIMIIGVLAFVFIVSAQQVAAEQNIHLILDASGSMWGQIDGKPKIDIAKEVLTELINDLPEGVNMGLQVYGHRREGDCDDIEVLVPVGTGDKTTLLKQIQSIQPKGKTPITKSLRVAGEQLKSVKGETAIVLVSDGKETCEGDPCAVVKELREHGIQVKVHVIGFDVTEEEKQQLSCIAEAGGGKYFTAKNAPQLKEALTEVKKEIVSKPKGKILFVRFFMDNSNLYSRLYIINADGTDEKLLISGRNMSFSFSPDGKRIAVCLVRDDKWGLYVMNANGTGQILLAEGHSIGSPDWSPDGKRIAFMVNIDEHYEIFVINADGSNKRHLVKNGIGPRWSPDGRYIAFVEDGLHVMNADVTGKPISKKGFVMTRCFDWSPDGKRIVFSEEGSIYVMNADVTNLVRLTSGHTPTWSPDGKHIAYRNENNQIYMMNADATNQICLLNKPDREHYSPTWSPDGRHIAFISILPGGYSNDPASPPDICIVSADGSNPTLITKGALVDGNKLWIDVGAQ
jgi:Tol biopolymer transport system component